MAVGLWRAKVAAACAATMVLSGAAPGWAPGAAAMGPGEGPAPEQRPGPRVMGDGLIVPGQRIGSLRLAMALDQILRAVGSHAKREEFKAEGVVLYEWRTEGIWVSVSAAGKAIRLISVFGTSDQYRTDRGVSLLHPRSKMEEAHGKDFKEYDYPEDRITLIRYQGLGLQFAIVNQPSNFTIHNRIFQIGVFMPGDLPPLRQPGQKP